MAWNDIRDLFDAGSIARTSSRLVAKTFAIKMLPFPRKGTPLEERAQAELPAELMVHIVSWVHSETDRRALRMLNQQWRAAVDECVTRLSGNMYMVRDKDLERLRAYRQLQSLDLSQCGALTDLAGLHQLATLQSLQLNCCRGLKAGALDVLAELPRLQKLDLSCCSGLTDDCMAAITEIESLEWLSLQGCTGLSAAGLSQLQCCRRLRYLDLSGTQVVGLGFLQVRSAFKKGSQVPGRIIFLQADASSRAVSAPCHSSGPRSLLRQLRLADCDHLAESALCSLIGQAELETLDLSRSTHALTGPSVVALQQLEGLRRLVLGGSPDLCDATLLKLTALQGLTHLDVSECPHTSPGALSALQQRMPATCAVYSATS